MKNNGEIKIEKNIAIPKSHSPRLKYPWMQLKIGESFFVPNKKPVDLSGSKNWASFKTGFKFVCREMDGGVRTWRVA